MKQSPKAFFDMLANTQDVVPKATTCPPGRENARLLATYSINQLPSIGLFHSI